MIIRVVKRDHPYVMIDKTALEDPRLSFRAKGLHAYLLSKPDNWTPNRDQLATISREGRDAVAVALKELETAGYLLREKKQDEETKRFYWLATVYEVSQHPLTEKPSLANQATGLPSTENPPVISKEVKKKENKKTSAAKPRFPAEWYERNVADYQEIKGVTLSGPEFGEIQRTLKTIYQASHKPEDVRALMKAFEASKEEWTDNWTIHTVARKLPDFLGGKLFRVNGRDANRIRALKDDIAEIDRYLEYQIEARLAKLGWLARDNGGLSLEESEEKERLERIRSEKQAERVELTRQLRGLEVRTDESLSR